MKFTIIDGCDDRVVYKRIPENTSLGSVFKDHQESIQACEINGKYRTDWQTYKVQKKDAISVYCKYGDAGIIVSLLLSLAFSALSTLFSPEPNKPSGAKNQPALGVAGIQNTVAPGTPKFLVYGIRRVFGHLIASKVSLRDPLKKLGSPDFGTKMDFSALYFMGVGPILDITDIQINGTFITDIEDGNPESIIRLGTQDQEIIPNHEIVHQVYHDGRNMDVLLKEDRKDGKEPDSIIYTTNSTTVNKITLFFQFPQGLWANNTGILNGQSYSVRVEGKKHGVDCEWIDFGLFTTPRKMLQRGFFWQIEVELPSAGKWDIRLTTEDQDSYRRTSAPFLLFNVQETQYITTTYPGNALLEIHGIASDQITSFDDMEASALVCGRFVDVYSDGVYSKQFSRNRVWIIRDLLFDQDVGLGNRLNSSLWDNGAGLDAANYYEESVTGFEGAEQRDFCDVVINETKPGLDWLKTLLFEGSATIIPSGGKYKYIIDKDKTPQLLYSSPGNIIENTLQYQRGSSEKPINTIRAEFADADNEYKVVPAKYPASVDEPEKAETISLTSITRESQVSRFMQFRYNYLTLIKNRWTWQAPGTAAVSEPYDVDKLTYQVSEGLRGYAGLINNDSSTTTAVYVDKEIYLAPGITYTATIRQQETVEEKGLSNALGNTYSVLQLSSALSFTPQVGDIWSVGEQNSYTRIIQFEEIEFDGENYKLTAHEHIPAVYSAQSTSVTSFESVTGITPSPRPLLGAQVIAGATFWVITGFETLVGTYSNVSGLTVTLDTKEPAVDDFFNDAELTIDTETLTVTDYEGDSRIITVETPGFLLASTPTGTYEINWPTASKFYGFNVAGSTDAAGPFSTTDITPYEADATILSSVIGTTYTHFQITPYDYNGNENTTGRWVIGVGTTDSTAPQPPLLVDITSDATKNVTLIVTLEAPLERDVQYIQYEFLEDSPTGAAVPYHTITKDISDYRDENTTGTINLSVQNNLSWYDYGSVFYGRVATVDFYGNISPYAVSFRSTTLASLDTDDDDIIVDSEDTTSTASTAGTTFTIFSGTVSGGVLTGLNAVELDAYLSVTQAPGSTTTLDFYYLFAGSTTSTLSVDATNLEVGDPLWLNYLIEANQSQAAQVISASLYADGAYQSDVQGGAFDGTIDQPIQLLMSITGDTNTEITVNYVSLRTRIPPADFNSTGLIYNVAGTYIGQPLANQTVLIHPIPTNQSVVFPATLVGSKGVLNKSAASAAATFSILKNGIEFGTMAFPSGGAVPISATFLAATETTFVGGDILTVVAPSVKDISLEDLGFTIVGTRE